MSQHDMDVANGPGSAFRADMNLALLALVGNNSGATAPATTFPYQFWADTASGWLKQRNAANTAWEKKLPIAAARIDMASATTLNLDADAASSGYLRITGTTTITAVTLADGQQRYAVAGGAFQLSNGASLVLPGGANYTTSLGDILLFLGESGGVVRAVIWKADGTPVVGGSSRQIQSLPDPTLASNAMTLPASTHTLDFRSATLTTGATSTVSGTAAALVIPSGATLGSVNGQQNTLVEVILNNGGTLEKAVVNLAGGNDLSETGVISTTAISAAATASNVFYSNTARTNVPYRVVRSITSTQATAGQWATNPSLVQGQGGQALSAMSSLGYGQTWQDVFGSRSIGVTYYNSTGKAIEINMCFGTSGTNNTMYFTVNGVVVMSTVAASSAISAIPVSTVVPPGGSYRADNTAGGITVWREFR